MEQEQELLAVARSWDAAMLRNDAEEIGLFLSDDWVIIGTEGGITDKDAFLDWIRSGSVKHHRMDTDELQVKLFDNTGILISRGTSAGHFNGTPFDLYEWSSNVFRYANGKWLCVLTMLTPALKDAAR